MSVIDIREMRVAVCQSGMLMGVAVGLARRITGPVRMLVVLVVDVSVGMDGRLVDVVVLMPFGEV